MTSTLLRRGFAFLSRGMEAAAVETVRYLRGSEVLNDGLSAALSAPDVELMTAGGASVVGREFLWQLSKAGMASYAPLRDDVIEWVDGSTVYTFELLPDRSQAEAGAVDPRSDWWPVAAKLVERRTA